MKKILQQHASRFAVEDPDHVCCQQVIVRRSNIVDCSINQFHRANFNLEKPFRVRFIGEPAVDIGGPKRELFRLFLQGMAREPSLFQSTQEGLLPAHNITALTRGDFRIVGTILAPVSSLVGLPLMCFVPAIADMVTYGELKSLLSIEWCDPDIAGKLKEVCSLGIKFSTYCKIIMFPSIVATSSTVIKRQGNKINDY